jgi:hypothetical protein
VPGAGFFGTIEFIEFVGFVEFIGFGGKPKAVSG